MAVEKILYTDNLRNGTDKINAAIDLSNESKVESASAKTTADNAVQAADGAVVIANSAVSTAGNAVQIANDKADATQSQLDTIILESGTSDAETIQARGGEDLLYKRLDKTDSHLAETEQVITDGGLDSIGVTSKFITTMLSWIGLVNTAYEPDNATRFYLLPKDVVTTGVGGAHKIFFDPYQVGGDYRDGGWYAHADQFNSMTGKSDKGSNGTGVLWHNSKVEGVSYKNKNPDMGYSFQDGQYVAGRWALVNGNPCLIVGPDVGKFHGEYNSFGAEFQKNIVLYADKGIYFEGANGLAHNAIRYSSTTETLEVIKDGEVGIQFSKDKVKYISSIVQGYVGITNNSATPSVRKGNVYVISNTSNTNITDLLNGEAGQQVTIIINDTLTTLQNNAFIKLKGSTNFRPVNLLSNITLMRLGSQWVETARTEL